MLAHLNSLIHGAKTRDEAWAAVNPACNALAAPVDRDAARQHCERVIDQTFPNVLETSATYPTSYGLGVSVRLIRNNGARTVRVEVIAPIHKEKLWTMPHSYSDAFTDGQILRDSDFVRVMSRAYPRD